MEALGLQQHVNQPTHQKGNILDLIFTEITSKINLRELEILDFISDHWLISATIDVKKDLLRITKRKSETSKEVGLATMMEKFQQPKLIQLLYLWNRTFRLILDKLSFTAVNFIRSENNNAVFAIIYVTKTLSVYALNSEHGHSVLC